MKIMSYLTEEIEEYYDKYCVGAINFLEPITKIQ